MKFHYDIQKNKIVPSASIKDKSKCYGCISLKLLNNGRGFLKAQWYDVLGVKKWKRISLNNNRKEGECLDIIKEFMQDDMSLLKMRDDERRANKDVIGYWFEYDISTISCLRRRNALHIDKVGAFSSELDSNGYYRTKWNGKYHKVHRIIWELHYGEIPKDLQIDHINGDRTDNRIENLRLVTSQINAQNRKMINKNIVGKTGISRRLFRGQFWCWIAQWALPDGANKSKCFSCLKYGEDRAKLLASQYRDLMIEHQNLNGMYYTVRHGG